MGSIGPLGPHGSKCLVLADNYTTNKNLQPQLNEKSKRIILNSDSVIGKLN